MLIVPENVEKNMMNIKWIIYCKNNMSSQSILASITE